jgi:hypothetical protein
VTYFVGPQLKYRTSVEIHTAAATEATEINKFLATSATVLTF